MTISWWKDTGTGELFLFKARSFILTFGTSPSGVMVISCVHVFIDIRFHGRYLYFFDVVVYQIYLYIMLGCENVFSEAVCTFSTIKCSWTSFCTCCCWWYYDDDDNVIFQTIYVYACYILGCVALHTSVVRFAVYPPRVVLTSRSPNNTLCRWKSEV